MRNKCGLTHPEEVTLRCYAWIVSQLFFWTCESTNFTRLIFWAHLKKEKKIFSSNDTLMHGQAAVPFTSQRCLWRDGCCTDKLRQEEKLFDAEDSLCITRCYFNFECISALAEYKHIVTLEFINPPPGLIHRQDIY